MKRMIAAVMMAALLMSGCAKKSSPVFQYEYADAKKASELLLANREYYEGLNQRDLDFRVHVKGATLAELEEIVRRETRNFSEEEMKSIDEAMAEIEKICEERGYHLPSIDNIVFAKTTMAEECDAGAYTHGTEIYLGEAVLSYAKDPENAEYFKTVLAHELFHCLTRNHPDFRKNMYEVIGFTATGEEVPFGEEVKEVMISNPDVEHHDAWAEFEINGEKKKCVAVLTTETPFEKPGDSFFDTMYTGLVPLDDPDRMYRSEEASNFWDLFGRNTDYVIDPEEAMADNFSFTMIYGPEGKDYKTPEIIRDIDRRLKEMK